MLGRCVSWKTLVDDLFVGAGVLAGRSPKKSRSLVGHRVFVCLLERKVDPWLTIVLFSLQVSFFTLLIHVTYSQLPGSGEGRATKIPRQ